MSFKFTVTSVQRKPSLKARLSHGSLSKYAIGRQLLHNIKQTLLFHLGKRYLESLK